jgi:O-antigen/teichoic acid export membrane protein
MLFDRIRSLLKHAAVYGAGDIAGRAMSVLLFAVYARMLTTEANGVRILGFTFVGFAAVFYSLGLNQALLRYIARAGEAGDTKKNFSSAFFTIACLGACLSALLWIFSEPLARGVLGSTAYGDIFRLMGVIIFLDSLCEPQFTLCRARQKSGTYATVRLCQHTLQLGLTVVLIAFLDYGVRAVFWSNVASSAFAFAALLPVGLRQLRPVFSLSAVRGLLVFGLPFVPSALSQLVIDLSDRFMIKFYLGVDAAGIYGIVYVLSLPMLLLVRVLRAAWVPAILDIEDQREAGPLVARVMTYFVASTGLLFLVTVSFRRELIGLICGGNAADYLTAEGIVGPITFAYMLFGAYVLLTAGVFTEGRSRMLPAIVGGGAAVNVAINLVFIPRVGLVAAAWSTAVAYGLMVLLLYFSVRRFYPVDFEYRRLAKILIAGAVVLVASGSFGQDSTISGTVSRRILLLGFPLILWGWGFFQKDELAQLKSMFRHSNRSTQS